MNVKAISSSVVRTPKSSLFKRPIKLANYILGVGLMLSAGAAKADEQPNNNILKTVKISIVDEPAKTQTDKKIIGEALFGAGILTYMGLCLRGKNREKHE